LLGALLVALVAWHDPFLRLTAGLLTADESVDDARWLVPLSGDQVDDRVSDLLRAAPETRILLVEHAPSRLQSSGVLPSWVQWHYKLLLARGVPEESVDVLSGATETDWDRARVLGGWLEHHPGAEVAVLCGQFASRRMRVILDRVLGPMAARARIIALPDRRYDETNWWRSKDGVAAWWAGLAGLGFVALVGEGDRPMPPRDPDEYARSLR
jgi:hypothetical protein